MEYHHPINPDSSDNSQRRLMLLPEMLFRLHQCDYNAHPDQWPALRQACNTNEVEKVRQGCKLDDKNPDGQNVNPETIAKNIKANDLPINLLGSYEKTTNIRTTWLSDEFKNIPPSFLIKAKEAIEEASDIKLESKNHLYEPIVNDSLSTIGLQISLEDVLNINLDDVLFEEIEAGKSCAADFIRIAYKAFQEEREKE